MIKHGKYIAVRGEVGGRFRVHIKQIINKIKLKNHFLCLCFLSNELEIYFPQIKSNTSTGKILFI